MKRIEDLKLKPVEMKSIKYKYKTGVHKRQIKISVFDTRLLTDPEFFHHTRFLYLSFTYSTNLDNFIYM